jgi:hypothetical protein
MRFKVKGCILSLDKTWRECHFALFDLQSGRKSVYCKAISHKLSKRKFCQDGVLRATPGIKIPGSWKPLRG